MASTYTLTIPADYGYVLLATSTTFVVGLLHGLKTFAYRKPAKVPYPNAYATPEQAAANPSAYLLNCAQRAHANYTENLSSTVTALMIAGLDYPRTAAAAGTAWSLLRWIYLEGYCSTEKPEGRGRYRGGLHTLFQLVLYAMAGWTSLKMTIGTL